MMIMSKQRKSIGTPEEDSTQCIALNSRTPTQAEDYRVGLFTARLEERASFAAAAEACVDVAPEANPSKDKIRRGEIARIAFLGAFCAFADRSQ